MRELSGLFWLVKTVEAGSMSRAAKHGGISVSTLSDRIRALEQELGIRLLERSTRQWRLTEAGHLFHEQARSAVRCIEAARDDALGWADAPSGLLTISAPPEVTRHRRWLRALCQLSDTYPQVRIRMVLTHLRSDLIKEPIDLAIRVGQLDDSQLVAQTIASLPLRLVARRCDAATRGEIRTPHDLDPVECMQIANLGTGKVWPWLFEKRGPSGLEQVRFEPKGPVEMTSIGAALDWVPECGGITVINDLLVPDDRRDELEYLLPEWQLPVTPIWAVTPSRTHVSSKVRVCIELLRDALSGIETTGV